MTSAFSWQNSTSLCPASFCTPRPNLPVTPSVSWLPTFAFQSPKMIKYHIFWLLSLKLQLQTAWLFIPIFPFYFSYSSRSHFTVYEVFYLFLYVLLYNANSMRLSIDCLIYYCIHRICKHLAHNRISIIIFQMKEHRVREPAKEKPFLGKFIFKKRVDNNPQSTETIRTERQTIYLASERPLVTLVRKSKGSGGC